MLKRLELVGFKSFAEKTAFEFSRGITAIVGPNGSGKCVVGSTLVTLPDGRDVPIRDLVEAALREAPETEALDDGTLTRHNRQGIHVLTLDPVTLRLRPAAVGAFVKREAPAELLRIRTRSGREITATPYHPLFTLENGGLRALRADELQIGVRIAVPRLLPLDGAEVALPASGVLEQFKEDDRVYVPPSSLLRHWAKDMRARLGSGVAWCWAAGVSQNRLKGLLEGQAVHAHSLVKLARAARTAPPVDGRLKSSNTPCELRVPDRLSPELARVLGLLLAEGRSTHSNQVWFVNSDPEINAEYERLARSLFRLSVYRTGYKASAEDSLVFSAAPGRLLERVFRLRVGSVSREKEAPPQLFGADAETQWAFLSGLFEGDAHVAVRGGQKGNRHYCYLEYVTASRRLAEQVVALLLRLGIFSLLRAKRKHATNSPRKRRRTNYQVLIYGTEQLRQTAERLSFSGAKAAKLAALRELAPARNPNLDLVPEATRLVKEAARVAGLPIKRHRQDCPKLAAYAEERCQASREGLLKVTGLIERCGRSSEAAREQLQTLTKRATSDVYWDEIVRVERIPPLDPWVYDLCVPETHNFVANNIIVHNSNVVDAVRWVLGEQSAKSLRGGEMADVIFNGSASRRSLGMAEVTMTFDNSGGALATETSEVQITRRVYRDGQGEYLINGQLSRLRDIKQLFLGSGAGADAYCIIEQGRVDSMLTASTQDRRTIFEEAAGISRFKAKKLETLRKLERVDQNLARLKDIIDEVEKQLRSVKLQAAKAQRYQEYSERLKQLRLALGLQDYHELAQRLAAETAVLEELRAGLEQQSSQAEAWEARMRQLEEALQRAEGAAREQEGRLAHARQQIAAEETTLNHEAALSADLETDLARARARLAELSARVASLMETDAHAAAELHAAEEQCAERQSALHRLEEEQESAARRLAELQAQLHDDKEAHLEQMRQAARLQNDAVSHKAHVDNLARERERLRLKSEQAAEHLASLDVELQELTEADAELQSRLAAARQALGDQRQERDRLGQLRDETAQLIADLRAQRSGLASRVEVLEGLERSQEGLGTGVREVMGLLAPSQAGPWRTVRGLVADFLTVRREYAPLIDLALGDMAQHFLVDDVALLHEALRQRGQPFSGRVSFLPLTAAQGETRFLGESGFLTAGRPNRLIELSPTRRVRMPTSAEGAPAHPGVIALAAALVTCDHPDLADLPAQLLGRTLIVRDLDAARAVAAHTSDFRFVTLQGELLEADGTLTVGTHHAETGILSRKSELRELRQQTAALDRRIAEAEQDLAGLRDRIADFDTRVEEAQEEIDVLSEQAADLRTRLGQHRQRREGLHEEVTLSRTEIGNLEQEIQTLEAAWHRARDEAARAEAQVQALLARMHQAEQETRRREEQRQQQEQAVTAAKVALAQVEERHSALEAKHRQTRADLEQRRRERDETGQHVTAARNRQAESQRLMLQCGAALAHWYLEKESAERRLAEVVQERDAHRQERHALAEQAQASRAAWRIQQEQAHARELEVNDLRHRRDTLVERLREDYQVCYRQSAPGNRPEVIGPDEQPLAIEPIADGRRPEAEEEIAELRRKLGRLGSVNLDALQELSDLETRASSLQTQYDDLTAAKRALEEIIAKINQDSRVLFTETFAAIRTHFQELFRKLFGGGMADIVLEDENDVLESGIEVVARPPGKELRSISLLSGGEKTMAAVALLLAIFRSRPSPFCILDEVDAALDEANIGRYASVLRDFLDRSHFIIITHSKRTMAAADVLYGVTMQESGVSKRVAVRFEDWPDDSRSPDAEPAAAERNGH